MIFQIGQRAWHFQFGWGKISGVTPTNCKFSTDSGSSYVDLYANGSSIKDGLPVIFLDKISPENWPNPVAPEPPVVIPDLQLDQPIMVRHSDSSSWVGRHVAEVCQVTGIVSTWQYGCTSFTRAHMGSLSKWPQWRLPTEDELKQYCKRRC